MISPNSILLGTDISSLLDDGDQYDPTITMSTLYSTVSTPTATNTIYSSRQ